MQKQRKTFTFEAGMRADTAPDLQPPGSYRDSFGMALRFQAGEGGQAMNLSAAVGAEAVMTLPAGYDDVGSVQVYLNGKLYLLLLLTNGEFCEFGLVDLDERITAITEEIGYIPPSATYLRLYSDQFDPGGARLGWAMGSSLRVALKTESKERIRIIVNDRTSEPLIIPLHLGFRNTATLQPHTTYPRYWSAHSFRLQPDVQFTTLKFSKRVAGSLVTGSYRYSYRYLMTPSDMPEEVVSVCFPPGPALLLPEGDPTTSSLNSHKVFLRQAGVITPFGLQFFLINPDARWSRVQLLASYSADNETFGPWVIADQVDNPGGALVTLTHKTPAGTGRYLPEGEITAAWQSIVKAQDVYPFEDRIWFGGPTVGLTGNLDASLASLTPFYRKMELDQTVAPRFSYGETSNTPADILQNVNLSVQPSVSETLYQRADGQYATILYDVDGDFATYKGIQIAMRHASYRHGETYPIGAMPLDLKGQPTSVIPLGTFTVPAQYKGDTLTYFDPVTNRYMLKTVGLLVSDLRIPRNVLFDKDGNQAISGIMIVRGKASGKILHQGVVTNLVKQTTHTEAPERLIVLPTFSNVADDAGLVQQVGGAVIIQQGTSYDFEHAGNALVQSQYVAYLSGDLLMEDSALTADKKRDSLELVVTAQPVYQPGFAAGANSRIAGPIHLAGDNDHTYTKNYELTPGLPRPDAKARPKPGDKSEVSLAFPVNTWGGDTKDLKIPFDPEAPEVSFQADMSAYVQQPDQPDHNTFKDGYVAKGTVILKVPGFTGPVDVGRDVYDPAGVMIANYTREVPVTPAEQINYFSTGHYLPFTAEVIATLPQNAGGDYLLNHVEVGGGDCYPTPVDMLRIYPNYQGGQRQPFRVPGVQNNDTGLDWPDYAIGIIVPLECKYNLWLRSDRHYAPNASYPGALAKGSTGLDQFKKSINRYQPEYWNVALATRLGIETVRLFKSRALDFRLDTELIYDYYYSTGSIEGESVFQARRVPVLNYGQLDGKYGPFIGFQEQFTYLYAGQPDGISRLRISERSQVIDESGKQITLGQGGVSDGEDYVVRGSGWSQWADSFMAARAMYWLDRRRGKMARLSQAGVDILSDRDGQHDAITAILSNPASPLLPGNRPIAGGYDPIHQRVLLSFHDQMLVYNEDLNAFEYRWSENPLRYHPFGGALLSRKGAVLFRHGTGKPGYAWGENGDLRVRLSINPMPVQASTFNKAILTLPKWAADALYQVDVRTQNQVQVLRRNESDWTYAENRLFITLMQTEVPDREGNPVEEFARLRGTVLDMVLHFNPASSARLVTMQSIAIDFRPSPRY